MIVVRVLLRIIVILILSVILLVIVIRVVVLMETVIIIVITLVIVVRVRAMIVIDKNNPLPAGRCLLAWQVQVVEGFLQRSYPPRVAVSEKGGKET